jgi:hypothetical protein
MTQQTAAAKASSQMRTGGTAKAVPFPKANDSLRSLVLVRVRDFGKSSELRLLRRHVSI